MRLADCATKPLNWFRRSEYWVKNRITARESGVQWGEEFAYAASVILDAIAIIVSGVGDLVRLFMWLLDGLKMVNDAVVKWFDDMVDSIVDFFTIDLFAHGQAMLTVVYRRVPVRQGRTDWRGVGCTGRGQRIPAVLSDAKRGPFSHLTESGRAIMETLARWVAKCRQPASGGRAVAGWPGSGGGCAQGVGGGGMTFTLSIGELNVTAHNADPQEIAQAIVGGELARQVRALVEQSDSQGTGLKKTPAANGCCAIATGNN